MKNASVKNKKLSNFIALLVFVATVIVFVSIFSINYVNSNTAYANTVVAECNLSVSVTAKVLKKGDADSYSLEISGIGTLESFSSSVPNEWHEKYDDKIESIVVKDGITDIKEESFQNLFFVKTIELPTSLVKIGKSAFKNCVKLEKMTIPFVGSSSNPENDVERPFGYIFGYTTLNETIVADEGSTVSAPSICFDNNVSYYSVNVETNTSLAEDGETEVIVNTYTYTAYTYLIPSSLHTVEIIGEYLGDNNSNRLSQFRCCKNIKNVVLGSKINTIPSYFLNSCTELNSIKILGNISSIGSYAFSNCSKLQETVIPCQNLKVNKQSFINCKKLNRVEFNGTVDNIQNDSALIVSNSSVFSGCSSLEKVIFDGYVRKIGSNAFANLKNIKEIVFADSVCVISESAFEGCINLTQISLGNAIQTIGASSFKNTGLTQIVIPNSVKIIGESAFSDNANLKEIIFETDSDTIIGDRSFYNCKKLSKVFLSDKIKGIGKEAFGTKLGVQNQLDHIFIPSSINSVSSGIVASSGFTSNSHTTIYTDAETKPNGWDENWNTDNYKEIDTHWNHKPQNVTFSIENASYSFVMSDILSFPIISSNSETDGLGLIAEYKPQRNGYTFLGWRQLLSNKKIDTEYSHNNLVTTWSTENEKIVMVATWQRKGVNFYVLDGNIYIFGCDNSKVEKIVDLNEIPINSEKIVEIQEYGFAERISDGVIHTTNIESIVIPNSVTNIETRAFYGCENLKSIFIPESVTSIGEGAFGSCNNLADMSVSDDNQKYFSDDSRNAILSKDKSKLFFGNSSCTIPSTVKTIGSYAFYNLTKLTNALIVSNVLKIEAQAFESCKNLTEAIILGDDTTYEFDLDNPKEETNSFCNSHISFKVLRPTLFGQILNSDLDYIVVNNKNGYSLIIYGNGIIPDGADASVLSESLFDNTNLINEVILRDGVRSIGRNAFNGFENLFSVTIGENVDNISENAFYECKALDSLIFLGNCPTIFDKNAFAACDFGKITLFYSTESYNWSEYGENYVCFIPGEGLSTKEHEVHSNCYELCSSSEISPIITEINDSGNYYYKDILGLVYSKNDNDNSVTVVRYESISNCLRIPSKVRLNGINYLVTAIADSAFKSSKAITGDVILPSNIRNIGGSAFEGSSAQKLFVLSGNCSISENAFANCNFEFVYFDRGRPKLPDLTLFKIHPIFSKNTETIILVNQIYYSSWNNSWASFSNRLNNNSSNKMLLYGVNKLNDERDGQGVVYSFDDDSNTAIVGRRTSVNDSFANTSESTYGMIVIPDYVKNKDSIFKVVGFDRYAFYANKLIQSIEFGGFIGESENDNEPAIYDCSFRDTPNLQKFILRSTIGTTSSYSVEDGVLYGKNFSYNIIDRVYNENTGKFVKKVLDTVSSPSRLIKYPQGKTDDSFTVKDDVTVIDRYAFAGSLFLQNICLNNANVIGSHAFYNCTNLINVYKKIVKRTETVPSESDPTQSEEKQFEEKQMNYQLQYIEDSAFENTDISSIIFAKSLSGIGTRAFWNTNLSGEVALYNNISYIGKNAFGLCENINKFVFMEVDLNGNETGETVCYSMNGNYFIGSFGELYGKNDEIDYSNESRIVVENAYDNKIITNDVKNVLINNNDYSLLHFPGKANEGVDFTYDMNSLSFSVKDENGELQPMNIQVTSISPYAFYSVRNLKKIIIGNFVVTIGSYAFENCENLTEVIIGDSYYGTSIKGEDGKYSYDLFSGCYALSNIVVSENNRHFTTDNNGVLYGKRISEDNQWIEGETLYCYPAGLTRVTYTIPAITNFIYDCAFANNVSIKQIVVSNVEKVRIGSRAFGDCVSLEGVYYYCPVPPYDQSGVKIYDNVSEAFSSYYKSSNANGWEYLTYFYEYPVKSFDVIKEVPNDNLETKQYIIVVTDVNGNPLENMHAFITVYDENKIPYTTELHSTENGLLLFSIAHMTLSQIRIRIYDDNEVYMPFDAEIYVDTEMYITYVPLIKVPDIHGISFNENDIYSQTAEFNVAQFAEVSSIIENDVEKDIRYYEDVTIDVQATWEPGLTCPIYTLEQSGTIIGTIENQSLSGKIVKFIISAGKFIPDVPIEVYISLKSGNERITTGKILNISVIDFAISEEDVDVNPEELAGDVGWGDNGNILSKLIGQDKLELNIGKHFSTSITIKGSEVTVGMKIKGDLAKATFGDDYKKGYETYHDGHNGNTYIFQYYNPILNMTFNIRFAKGTEDIDYYYYRLYVYKGMPGVEYGKSKIIEKYGGLNVLSLLSKNERGRERARPLSALIYADCLHYIYKNLDVETKLSVDKGLIIEETKITLDLITKLDKYKPIAENVRDQLSKSSGSAKITGSLEGSLTFEYNSGTKRLSLKSGSVTGQIKFVYSHNSQWMFFAVPLTVDTKIDFTGKIQLNLKFDAEQKISVKNICFELKAAFDITAGVGCKVLSAGVYGNVAFACTVTIDPQLWPDISCKYSLSGELGFYLKVLWFTGKIQLFDSKKDDFAINGSGGRWRHHFSAASETDGIAYDDYMLRSAMFLSENYEYIGYNDELTEEDFASNGRIVICGENIYRLYVTYRDNKTKLAYSKLLDDGSWSEGNLIDNNEFADADFALIERNGELYLIYTQQTKMMTSEMMNDMYESAQGLSIKYIKFSANGLDNSDPVTIVDGREITQYKYLPQVAFVNGRLIVAWVQNADNNVFGVSPYNESQSTDYNGMELQVPTSIYSTNANSIWIAELINGEWVKKCLKSGLSSIVDIAITNSGELWYVEDLDGDLADNSDCTLFALAIPENLSVLNEEQTVITCDTNIAGVISIFAKDSYLIYYTKDGLFYNLSRELSDNISAISLLEGIDLSKGYKLIGEPNNPFAIVFIKPNTTESDSISFDTLCAVFFDSERKKWGEPITLFSPNLGNFDESVTALNIVSFDAVSEKSGDENEKYPYKKLYLSLSFNKVENGETVDVNLRYNAVIDFSSMDGSPNVALKEILYKENSAVFEIVNDTISAKSIRVFGGVFVVDGENVVESSSITLLAGERRRIIVRFENVYQNVSTVSFITEIDGKDETVYNESIDVSYCDLKVYSKQLVFGDTNEQLIGIKNNGNAIAKNYTVYIVAGIPEKDSKGSYLNLIDSVQGKDLFPNKMSYYRLTLDYSMMVDNDGRLKGDGILSIIVELNGEASDPYPEDNRDSYYLSTIEQLKLGSAKPVLLTTEGTIYKGNENSLVLSIICNTSKYSIRISDENNQELFVKNVDDENEVRKIDITLDYKILSYMENGKRILKIETFDADGIGVYTAEYLLTVAESSKIIIDSPSSLPDETDVIVTWRVEDAVTIEYYEKGVIPSYKIDGNVVNPTKNGYEFVGWEYFDGEKIIVSKKLLLTSDDITYRAVFEEKLNEIEYYTIIWIFDNDKGIRSKSIIAFDSVPAAPITPKGFGKIDKWINENGETVEIGIALNADSTLIAVYHQHDYVLEYGKAESCLNEGINRYRCSSCDYSYEEIIPASGHSFGDWIIDEFASCMHVGLRHRDCIHEGCDEREQEVINVTDHDWNLVNGKKPTCTNDGFADYEQCSVCKLIRGYTVIDKIVHAPIKDAAVSATCTTTGLTEGSHCSVCGTVIIEQKIVPSTGHELEESFTIDIAPICDKAGLKSIHCKNCEYSESITVVPALGHSFGTWIIDGVATCTEKGVRHHECLICDYSESEEIQTINHTFIKRLGKASSCIEEGYTDYEECSACGQLRGYKTLNKISHASVIDEGFYATCTTTGLTEGAHCSVCGIVLVAQKIIPTASAHISSAWIIDADSSCTTDGRKHKECTLCRTILETQTIHTEGHDLEESFTIDIAPTCEKSGFKSVHCKNCDYVASSTVLPSLGHSYDEWIVDKNATCTEKGRRHRVCSVCDNIENEDVQLAEHNWQRQSGKEATCVENGYTDYDKCSECGQIKGFFVRNKLTHTIVIDKSVSPTCKSEGLTEGAHCSICEEILIAQIVVPKTSHEWSIWTVEKEATSEETGLSRRKCRLCGEEETKVIEKIEVHIDDFIVAMKVIESLPEIDRFEYIKLAIREYNKLSEYEKSVVSDDYEQLKGYARSYNETIKQYEQSYDNGANNALAVFAYWQDFSHLLVVIAVALKSLL